MTFRTKLLLISSFTVAGAVALVTGAVSVSARRAFERVDRERRDALLDQFRRELDARGKEVSRQVERAAQSTVVQQIVAGNAPYDAAQAEAEAESLDFLDVVHPDLTIISSAHWTARFGYQNDWNISRDDWDSGDSFLAEIPLPEGKAIALIAIRRVAGRAYVAGGRRLSPEFLKSLGVAPGMRAVLWLSSDEVIDAQGPLAHAGKLGQLVERVTNKRSQAEGVVQWTGDRSNSEAFIGIPLTRRHGTAYSLGVLLAGTSLREQFALEKSILWIGVGVGLGGILIGCLVGWWTTERVTHPVAQLAAGARAVAAGDWSVHVEVLSKDEIGELAQAFNSMTRQLIEQRDRAIQAERVAAWRELARRLAHELKNPLFPLQITVENLQRARERPEFDEVFRESTGTLLVELANLKTIVGRFSDFAKMPPPRFEAVDVNEIVREVMKLYDARFRKDPAIIEPVTELADGELGAPVDSEQLRRALGNLVLNAMDAMPAGGTLRISTNRTETGVRVSVSDSGQGLTEEECSRLFTPYYTTKQHGTGLGLAMVQSVVSDHHGKISVISKPGTGATFVIDLPAVQDT
jgi:two-component system nitrogen regulation sensor histidine kinase NtrY